MQGPVDKPDRGGPWLVDLAHVLGDSKFGDSYEVHLQNPLQMTASNAAKVSKSLNVYHSDQFRKFMSMWRGTIGLMSQREEGELMSQREEAELMIAALQEKGGAQDIIDKIKANFRN